MDESRTLRIAALRRERDAQGVERTAFIRYVVYVSLACAAAANSLTTHTRRHVYHKTQIAATTSSRSTPTRTRWPSSWTGRGGCRSRCSRWAKSSTRSGSASPEPSGRVGGRAVCMGWGGGVWDV